MTEIEYLDFEKPIEDLMLNLQQAEQLGREGIEVKQTISDLKKKSGKTPSLTVILIGDFAPSLIYVKNKEKSAKEVGIHSNVVRYSKDAK